MKPTLLALISCCLLAAGHPAPAQLSPRLERALEAAGPQGVLPVMVYFGDKGPQGKNDLAGALEARRGQLTERALKRRGKMGLSELSFADLPVHAPYVEQIIGQGARHRQTLNWFNAASFEMTAGQVGACSRLPFVDRIDLLASRLRQRPAEPGAEPSPPAKIDPGKAHLLSYGNSYAQLRLSNIEVCHDSGYSGQGVLVAMLDNGYRRNHQAFDSIRTQGRLVDEWDFVTGADTVAWDAHGTGTWSLAGAHVPGQLVGPAYRALWAIYHTEDMSQEMPVEEDHWAAALQRADSIGADVVSSSLGYRDFDVPSLSYDYEDLDGNTAISTLAARHAAALGIVVCNSMANSGPALGTLAAPADADSMISVGATDSFGVISSYSSRGPTYDGRPKPEVCAQGTQTWWASWSTATSYGRASGTSCATPLVAGVCALIIEAHPDWTPLQVREALIMTASHSASPDSSTYGWGVVNAWAAINYSSSGVPSSREPLVTPGCNLNLSCHPNPMAGLASIRYRVPLAGRARLSVYDISGRLVHQTPAVTTIPGENSFTWKARDERGRPLANGIYILRVEAGSRYGMARAVLVR